MSAWSSVFVNEPALTVPKCNTGETNRLIKPENVLLEESNIKFDFIEEHKGFRNKIEPLDSSRKLKKINELEKRRRKKKTESKCSISSKTSTSPSKLKKNLKTYKCKHEGCDELFSSSNRRYNMTKHNNTRFEYDIRKASFATKSQIRVHILNVHDPTSKKFKCEVCGSSYLTSNQRNVDLAP